MAEFSGDKKKGQSLLHKPEKAFVGWAVPKIPWYLETYHLTALTFVWSLGIIYAGYLAQSNLAWMHAISVFVFLQWLTDATDGAVGRHRDTGLIKWGYFADHILDMFFAGSLTIGYMLVVQDHYFLFASILLATCMIMAITFLSMAATNEFQIAYNGIGPTEIRIAYIAMNTFVAIEGTSVFAWGVPLVLGINLIVLARLVAVVSSNLWKLDMEAKSDRMGLPQKSTNQVDSRLDEKKSSAPKPTHRQQ